MMYSLMDSTGLLRVTGIMACLVFASLLMSLMCPGNLFAADQDQLCQRLEQKIRYYTQLRRAGGTSKAMNGWYKKRQALKEQYYQHRCRQR